MKVCADRRRAIRLDHLTEAQAKAFMIADNRLTEISVWDARGLAEQLKELSDLDLDFSLEANGFEMGEIDFRIEGLTAASEDDRDPADALPAVRTGPAISRSGDLWLLGENRVGRRERKLASCVLVTIFELAESLR
jgi:hypothetical protein